jgi:hypothetical protein
MAKHTDEHHTLNAPTDCIEPSKALGQEYLNPDPNRGPDLDEPEPAPAPTRLAQRFFTLAQAGKLFGKTPRTMRWWADTGRIRTIKIGASRFITEVEIERLQSSREG